MFPAAERLVFQSQAFNNPAGEEDSISQSDYPAAGCVSLPSRPFGSAAPSPRTPHHDQALPWVSPNPAAGTGRSPAASLHRHRHRSPRLPARRWGSGCEGPQPGPGDGKGPVPWRWEGAHGPSDGKGPVPPLRPAPLTLDCGSVQHGEVHSPQPHLGLIARLANLVANLINVPFIFKLTVEILNKTGLSKSPLNSAENLSALLRQLQASLPALVPVPASGQPELLTRRITKCSPKP